MDPARPLGQSWIDSTTDYIDEMRVESSDEVRRYVEAPGGELHIWLTQHGWRFWGLTLVEAGTEAPGRGRHFRRIRSRGLGFDLYWQAGCCRWPRRLVLEMAKRGHKVRAYWNGVAYVV
jgi:hypothetical protein